MNKLPLSESQLARMSWMGPSICYGGKKWLVQFSLLSGALLVGK